MKAACGLGVRFSSRLLASAVFAAGTLAACADDDGVRAAEAEPFEDMPGGDTTNTLLFGSQAYSMPAANITTEHESLFFSGNGFFNQAWVEAPSSTQSRDGLGPLFNARSCAACHFKDGRGRPPLEPDEAFLGLLLRLSVPGEGAHGGPAAEPSYGGQLQPFAIPGVPAEGRPIVRYREEPGAYADGEPYALSVPTYEIVDLAHGAMQSDVRISPRVAPAMIGLGLLEAIDDERLVSLEDPDDANHDGVSGRANRVWDAIAQREAIGRFGWKAEQPTVRQQSAGAFLGDIGITTQLFSTETCTDAQNECKAALSGGAPELLDHLLDRVAAYGRLLAVPQRDRHKNPTVLRGKLLFSEAGCAGCHVPSHRTGQGHELIELRDQLIWPYTDLLLHDMGEKLSDHRPSFKAEGAEWRTPPLWGLRFLEDVNGHRRLLHDGRARGVAEAILWHGGEAEHSRSKFVEMPSADRKAIVEFVESL